ncbi:MAG TPA: WD40 repeat domain-containing protein [Anaerolineales bacterium]|nr:WD40 repeat domain-containing protein [Anaerolineales bacterium]
MLPGICCHFTLQPLLAAFPAHYQPVTGLAFSPDRELLASGSEDGSVFLWGLPGD